MTDDERDQLLADMVWRSVVMTEAIERLARVVKALAHRAEADDEWAVHVHAPVDQRRGPVSLDPRRDREMERVGLAAISLLEPKD